MQDSQFSVSQTQSSTIAINKVLRNTYFLLSLTLMFSAVMAAVAIAINAAPVNIFIVLIGFYGLLFAIKANNTRNLGILLVFALTGFMGFTLGPILNLYMASYTNGGQLVMMALGGTGLIFFALSGYVLTTQKDFSFLGGFIFVGLIVALLAMVASFIFNVPGLALAVSAVFIMLSSAIILYQTSAIINGGERNYIDATVTLFVSLYNIFVSLLNILSAFSGRD